MNDWDREKIEKHLNAGRAGLVTDVKERCGVDLADVVIDAFLAVEAQVNERFQLLSEKLLAADRRALAAERANASLRKKLPKS